LREGSVYEVGRAEPSDIVLRIPTVSTRHALLRVDGGGRVSVTDLNSTNGTAVNGVELDATSPSAEVPLGGEIVFGDSYLARFQLEAVVGADDGAGAGGGGSGSGAGPSGSGGQ
jgi:pSer/pThr/pTyr-binding forkhead associated (FHA) protein